MISLTKYIIGHIHEKVWNIPMLSKQQVPMKSLEEEKKLVAKKKGELMTLKDELFEALKEITPIFQKPSISHKLTSDLETKITKD